MLLDSNRIEEIENVTLDILSETYGDVDGIVPPIDIEKVIPKYNLKFEIGQFSDPEVSGSYNRSERKILIAENDPYKRQVFTLAHELGHFVLHEKTSEEIFYRKDALKLSNKKNQAETEANWFAASLLMPSFLVKRAWMIRKSVKFIADFFYVSHVTSYYRLKNLGLLQEKEELEQIRKIKKMSFLKKSFAI